VAVNIDFYILETPPFARAEKAVLLQRAQDRFDSCKQFFEAEWI